MHANEQQHVHECTFTDWIPLVLFFSMHSVTGHKLVVLMKIPFRAASVTEASRDCTSELSKHILYITDHLQPETILESAGETVWTLGTFKGFKKAFLPTVQ